MQQNYVAAVERDTVSNYGTFARNTKGSLVLTFSRDACGDGNLKLLLSDLMSNPVARGEKAVFTPEMLDYLSKTPEALCDNVRIRAGQTPDEIVVEIDLMNLAP